MILIYYYFPSFYFKTHIKIDTRYTINLLWPLHTYVDIIRFYE